VLPLSAKQHQLLGGKEPGDVMPEYYVLKVNGFDAVAQDRLDEWISFLKTGDIKDSFTAKGLAEARERLRVDSLPDDERREFFRELERQMVENDVMDSKYIDGKDEGLKEGKKEREKEIAQEMKADGIPFATIIKYTGLSEEEIARL
jgi:predicted transposase/invertase (TIGR01784 family)